MNTVTIKGIQSVLQKIICVIESAHYSRIMKIYVEISHKSDLDFLLIILGMIKLIENITERETTKIS